MKLPSILSLLSLSLVIMTVQAQGQTCADELNFLTERISNPLKAALTEESLVDSLQVRLKYGHRFVQKENDGQLILNDLVLKLKEKGHVERAVLGEVNEFAAFPEIEFQGSPKSIKAIIEQSPELLRAELSHEVGWAPDYYYETDGTTQLSLALLEQPSSPAGRHDLGTGSHEVRLSYELQRTLLDEGSPGLISLTLAGQAPVPAGKRQDFALQVASELKSRGFIVKALFLSAKEWYRIDIAADSAEIVGLMGSAPAEIMMFTTDQFDKEIPFSFHTTQTPK